jgi:hypothetical protein
MWQNLVEYKYVRDITGIQVHCYVVECDKIWMWWNVAKSSLDSFQLGIPTKQNYFNY